MTFLFTDIEGSTALWERDHAAMATALARHDALLREVVEARGGHVFKLVGDAVFAAFPTAPAALAAALAGQRALAAEPWGDLGPVRVRMALHTATLIPHAGDYTGPPLNRVARLLAAGHGGQVLLSAATQHLVRLHLPPDTTLIDLGSHRLRDLLEPEHVYQLVAPDLLDTFPPLKSLEHHPTNLPLQPTPLIGRDQELAEVEALLERGDVRLVTLTGPGGTGKTRLAVQVAADLVESFPDGVFFVDLAPITDPALVLPTIAVTLGVRETGGQSLRDTLVAYCTGKQLLLLLDNVEQVLDAAPAIAELLSTCPALTLLATSRARLGLRAEHEYLVPPLATPNPVHMPPLSALARIASVALFVERATAARHDFRLTEAIAPAVAKICARLDGLPLAIELAAARVKALSPRAILERLTNRLKLLIGGARDLPERQQTLRTTIAWSYDLLSPAEQALFRRLAVFAEGFSLEAAERVIGAAGERELDILDGVEALVDQSLVRQASVRDGEDGEPRFTMLETIREFGLEQLAASGEADEAAQRHATYFLALAEEHQWGDSDPRVWLDRLEVERDNLRAALTWTSEHEPATAARLGAVLWRLWSIRGPLSEGRAWLERLLTARGEPVDSAVRAKLLLGAATMATHLGDLTRARSLLSEGLELTRASGDTHNTARMLHQTGNVITFEGDLERGGELYAEALALYRQVDNALGVTIMVNNLGEIARERGDLQRATELYEEALALATHHGDEIGVATAQLNLGMTDLARDDLGHAQERLGDALSCAVGQGDIALVAAALGGLARVAARHGQPLRAARLLGTLAAHRERTGISLEPMEQVLLDQTEANLRRLLDEPSFTAAWDTGRRMPQEEAVAEALAPVDAGTHQDDRAGGG